MTKDKFVLVTRPEEDAAEFARAIERAGFKTMTEPMLKILTLKFVMPGPDTYQAIVFTSPKAVRALPEGFRSSVPVYCVGNRTAEAAKLQGFKKIITAGGTVADLAALLRADTALKGKKILHIRGEHTAADGPENLGMDVATLVVYVARPVKAFSADCMKALEAGRIGAVTFLSRRTALTFVDLIEKAGLSHKLTGINLLCISEPVLECVRSHGWAGTYTAPTPDTGGMISLLDSLNN